MKISLNCFYLLLLLSLFSCKSFTFAELSAGKKNKNVLPALTPLIDVSSLESIYGLGTANTTGSFGSSYIFGSYIGTASYSTSFRKDPRIQDVLTIYDSEVKESITNPFGANRGYIAFKISRGGSRTRGKGMAILSGLTLLIPNLFGMSIGYIQTNIEVVVEIFDSNKNMVARYKGFGEGKAKMALWRGYSGPIAERKSNVDAFKMAMESIKEEINSDHRMIVNRLDGKD